MVNITDEASKVLLAVCLLKNLPWSRENNSESQFYALMAIKDAVKKYQQLMRIGKSKELQCGMGS